MKSLSVLIALSLPTISSFAFAAPQLEQAPIAGTVIPFTLRNATIDDVDDITTVYIEAFSRAPAWRYVRQFADKYPEYTWTCQRETFRQMFSNSSAEDHSVVKVISVPDPSSQKKERVVSFAAWEYGFLQQHSHTTLRSASFTERKGGVLFSVPMFDSVPDGMELDCSAHLDMNITRLQHVHRAMNYALNEYLIKPYGPQFSLALLATHPEWDGNGFASRHLHWGKEQLAEMNQAPEHADHRLPLTLLGTPAGYPLYISEGFEGLKNITIERLDGEGIIWFEAMKYDEIRS